MTRWTDSMEIRSARKKMEQMLGSLEYQVECGEWGAILGLCAGVLGTELERVRKLGH